MGSWLLLMVIGFTLAGTTAVLGRKWGFRGIASRKLTTALELTAGVWAALAVISAVGLCFADGAHPPPIALVPLVPVVWAGGHILLLIVAHMARVASSK